MAPKREPSRRKQPAPKYNNYLRYSGLGFQLLATLVISGWLGYKLDQYLDNKYPVFMLLFGFIGFSGSIYQVYRSITRD